MGAEEFGRLEERVEKLLAAYNELKMEKAGLQSIQGRLEEELKRLQSETERLQSERDEVCTRVNSLLGKLEEIEVSG
ncbi:MAG: cell division protein ZapB [Deltaproteobacteria bacterium]|jgi:FtsZ-binding cell division protein ZapB|nr:cell division protein ZapB [Thermodesulfobacteriota bacterium]MDP2800084.1 cell division protein ZapB [Deltaproteobacteria bacterium]MDP2992929.1 cell division protein ZapB [Deltaproteobacteria bacterium]MDP3028220.1 cell division protein ZapB [Deltaproteobacteria bacterium]TSA08749.1 MAG: cell division protein ZapB [Deltaproteobacteria bacterium]